MLKKNIFYIENFKENNRDLKLFVLSIILILLIIVLILINCVCYTGLGEKFSIEDKKYNLAIMAIFKNEQI